MPDRLDSKMLFLKPEQNKTKRPWGQFSVDCSEELVFLMSAEPFVTLGLDWISLPRDHCLVLRIVNRAAVNILNLQSIVLSEVRSKLEKKKK